MKGLGRRYAYGHRPPEVAEATARSGSARRARRYRAKNPEKIRASNTAYYWSDPERERERARRWRADNPEKAKALDARNNAARDREKVRENARVQKARRRGVPLTELGREYVAVLRGDPCAYCGVPMQEIDHIVAPGDGGDSDWPNLTAACSRCNGAKGDRPMLVFMARAESRSGSGPIRV